MTTWKLDTAHTQVNFSAKHMMVTTVRGTFHDVQGTIELDETDPTRSRGEFRVAAASVDTNFGARDAHLRSADFFDAETYPTITFVSTAISQRGDDRFDGDRRPDHPRRDQAGDLRRRARRHRARHERRAPRRAVGVDQARSATTGVSNWNVALEQGGWLVGKEIKLEIAIAADEVAAAERRSWSPPPPDPPAPSARGGARTDDRALLRAHDAPIDPSSGRRAV